MIRIATKQNMYVGLSKEATEILEEIERCIVMFELGKDGFEVISAYHVSSAKSISDEVAKMQGKLEIALKGLDKKSTKRENYNYMYRKCKDFLEKNKMRE